MFIGTCALYGWSTTHTSSDTGNNIYSLVFFDDSGHHASWELPKASFSAAAMMSSRLWALALMSLRSNSLSAFSVSAIEWFSASPISLTAALRSSTALSLSVNTRSRKAVSCFSSATTWVPSVTMNAELSQVSGNACTGSSSIFVRLPLAANTASMNCGSRFSLLSVSFEAFCWLSFFENPCPSQPATPSRQTRGRETSCPCGACGACPSTPSAGSPS